MGISLLAGTLVRSQHAQSPFAAMELAAHDASIKDTAYDVFLHSDANAADTAVGKRLLREAGKLHAQEKYKQAISTYDKAAAHLPQVADWIAVFAAASAARLGDTAQVERRLRPVEDQLADEWSWRTRSIAYERAGAKQRALDAAMTATKSGTAGKRAAAWYRVAELQSASGNASARKEALLSTLAAAAESEAVADAARALTSFTDLTPAQRRTVGRALMRNGEVSSGAKEIEKTLGGLDEKEAAALRYELGRALFGARRYADAEAQLVRVPAGSQHAADARFLLARSYARQGKDDLTTKTLTAVVRSSFPWRA